MKYPVLTLKPGKDRSVRNRHPWVYSGAVAGKVHASEGDIVEVQGADGKILAYGHYIPGRTITCRLFHFDKRESEFTTDYWIEKFRLALRLRQDLKFAGEHTTGFRLFHAEGDELPGLVADLYGDAASIQMRTKGMENLQPLLMDFLSLECGVKHVFAGSEEHDEGGVKGTWLLGGEGEHTFRENGIEFTADIGRGQKTGFFLDQRENRKLLGMFCAKTGGSLLNTFAYSGAFSAYALKHGASRVVSVDISAEAVRLCNENLDRNGLSANHEGIAADAFDFLKKLSPGEYDTIILDPPAFTKHISTVDKAARGYKEINLQAIRKVKPGGLVFTFSCSQHISTDLFRKIVFGAAADARRAVQVLHPLSQGPDHPVSIFHPEGEYLKGLVLHVN